MTLTFASGGGQRAESFLTPNYPIDVRVEPYSNMVATEIAVDKITA